MTDAMNKTFPLSPICLSFSDVIINNCTSVFITTIEIQNDKTGELNSKAAVSDTTRFYFELYVLVAANALLSMFGTVSNIINIIVYAKMGLGDVVNVSLLGLAVSDLISVFLVVWCSICYGLFLLDPPGLPFDPLTFWYVTAGWPHFIFSRVTCYITAMVSIERCLCVIAPFKVKEIVTPSRIKVCLVVIFTLFPSAYIPVLLVHKLAWKFDPNHNETRIMADYATNRDNIQAMSYYINDVFLPTLSLFIVMFCAIITARSLHRNAEWKKEKKIGFGNKDIGTKTDSDKNDTNLPKSNAISSKEMKVVRMLVVICVMFVVCYAPSVILIYIRFVYPDLAMYKTYHNLFISIYSFVFLLEIFNSSINIVIYYVMSSKFKKTFHELFSSFHSQVKTQ